MPRKPKGSPRTWFVTGGSRGIGSGIVKWAVEHGHEVAFTYVRNQDAANAVIDECKSLKPETKVRAYQLDVAHGDQVEAVADAVLEDFDTVEVVVNSAGINRDNLLVSMENDEWDAVIATNLTGPFYVMRQFLPTLMSNRWGRIVNISSIQNNGGTGQANYAASKAGLHGLTKTCAKEYGRKGVTANVVVPGFFDTDMTRDTMPQLAKDYWKQYCPVPKGRMGLIEELAATVGFLASEGGAFVNGEIINVTGGLNWTF
jgi:NAD(P)-dependent dehydrogenase (short-subunit alcohol dehydrogenase family)